MPDKASQLEGLRALYDAGAFLRLASPDKSLVGKMRGFEYITDASGDIQFATDPMGVPRALGSIKERARSWWGAIRAHVEQGGLILYYAPGEQGILILDFDPIIDERVDEMSGILGNHPYAVYQSSGKWKEASGSRPAGYGGHAVWKMDSSLASESAHIRRFSNLPSGDHWGEAFSGHPGYGVIVWDARALADTLDLDDCEIVDASKLPVARYSLASQAADGSWIGGEGSRHDAAVSALCRAAALSTTEQVMALQVAQIRAQFMASFSDADRMRASSVKGEWERMEAHAWEKWKRDRESQHQINIEATQAHNQLINLLRKGLQR